MQFTCNDEASKDIWRSLRSFTAFRKHLSFKNC